MLSVHEINDILDRLRDWLVETNEELQHLDPATRETFASLSPSAHSASSNALGLMELVESFTALRQEVKLHTKGLRGLQEDVQSQMQGLGQAVNVFERSKSDSRQAAAEAAEKEARPLIECLLDLDEALGNALATHASYPASQPADTWTAIRQEIDAAYTRLPVFQRALNKRWHDQVRDILARHRVGPAAPVDAAIGEGLRVLKARLERSLSAAKIERIESVGRPVDLQTMRVIEVVEDETVHAETVLAEFRPGYRWQGKIIRFAEVRAARPKQTMCLASHGQDR